MDSGKSDGHEGQAARSELDLATYHRLREIADRFGRESGRHATVRGTALVNEALLRLNARGDASWNRPNLLAMATQVMRSVLVDYARHRKAAKRGGGYERCYLDETCGAFESRSIDILALDAALLRLQSVDTRLAEIVNLRFFLDFSEGEIATMLGISERTVRRDWALARAWLQRELSKGE